MALSTTLSNNDIGIIQAMMSEHASSVPTEMIRSGILSLQGPVIEYVSKYIPAEYDESFEDIDTWLNTLSDLMVKRSCAKPSVKSSTRSSVKLSGDDASMVSRERCLSPSERNSRFLGRIRNMDPMRKGTRPRVMTEFRKTVAVMLVILALAHLITEDNPTLLFTLEKIQDNKIKIMETLINKYTSRREEADRRRVEYDRTGDVEYLD